MYNLSKKYEYLADNYTITKNPIFHTHHTKLKSKHKLRKSHRTGAQFHTNGVHRMYLQKLNK
jgi:hypothetical protein